MYNLIEENYHDGVQKMQFEYLQMITAQEHIDIDDIGNFCIQAFTPYGDTKILVVRTIDGISEIIDYGYINTDVAELPDEVNYSYRRIEFSQVKLIKIITKFINDKNVSQVFEITFDEAKSVIRNLIDCIASRPSDNVDYDRLV